MPEPSTATASRWWLAAPLLICCLVSAAAIPATAQEPEPAAAAAATMPAAAPTEPQEPPQPERLDPPKEAVAPDESAPTAAPEDEVRPEREERPERQRNRRNDAQVVVGSNLTVDADETSDDVLVIGGSLTVLGEVYGDAAAIGGSVIIEGQVMGDVSAVGGSVQVASGGEVMGDILSFGGSVERAEGAVVHGEVVEVNSPGVHWSMWPRVWSWGEWGNHGDDWFHVSPFDWAWSQAWRISILGVVVLVAFLALLLGRGPIERIGRRVESEPWKSGLVGLAAQLLFVPLLVVLCVVLAVSIIGIPFLLLVPFALLAVVIAIFFGYVGVALKLGDLLRERFGWTIDSHYVVLLVGILGLRIWSLIGEMLSFDGPPLRLFAALFSLFGFFVGYVAWTLATGGAILTRFGTAESWARQPAGLPPAAPGAASPASPAAPPPPAPAADEPWQPEVDDGGKE